MITASCPAKWRLRMPGNTAWTIATPTPISAAVATSSPALDTNSRAADPAAITASAAIIARRAPMRCSSAGPAKANTPINAIGTSVSSDMVWNVMPVSARIPPASGPVAVRNGRRLSPTSTTISRSSRRRGCSTELIFRPALTPDSLSPFGLSLSKPCTFLRAKKGSPSTSSGRTEGRSRATRQPRSACCHSI